MLYTERLQLGLGSGVYTFQETALLLRVSTTQVRGWADGYVYQLNGEPRRKEPVLQRRAPGPGLLTFYDLIELFFVREFRNAGVKLQVVRDAARLLSAKWDTPYPFACNKLDTDGTQILQASGEHYENVVRQQQVFKFAEDFFKNIDFDLEDCLAERWWPLGRKKLIVIDPHRSFGTPIEVKSGVRTDVVYATYKAEGDIQSVAEWYEIPAKAVEAAIEFEEEWKKAA